MKAVIVVLIGLVFVGFGGGYYLGSVIAKNADQQEMSIKDMRIQNLQNEVNSLNANLALRPTTDDYNKLRDEYNSLVGKLNTQSQRTSLNCFSNTYISGTFTNCY